MIHPEKKKGMLLKPSQQSYAGKKVAWQELYNLESKSKRGCVWERKGEMEGPREKEEGWD